MNENEQQDEMFKTLITLKGSLAMMEQIFIDMVSADGLPDDMADSLTETRESLIADKGGEVALKFRARGDDGDWIQFSFEMSIVDADHDSVGNITW